MRRFLACFFFLLFAPVQAMAAIVPGDPCTPAGVTGMSSNTVGFMNLLYCNGTVWVPSSFVIGNSVTTCNTANKGVISFTGTQLQWCDGTIWNTVLGSGTTNPGTPGGGGTGYFVMSSGVWNGNLGGRSGANTLCRTDLSNNSWMGKPGTLNTAKVFAFLCDGSACNIPTGNTNFYYAVSGSPTVGGAFFITNAYGEGPNDSYSWNASNRFGDSYPYWTNYNSNDNTYWDTSPYSDNCSNWSKSTSSYKGITGHSQWPDGGRWTYDYATCDETAHLICYVNP